VPGIDIRIDDPTIRIDTSSALYRIDSAYSPDPFLVAAGGAQSSGPILIGLANTTADAQAGNRLQSGFRVVSPAFGYSGGYDLSPTFDAEGNMSPTFDMSLVTMDQA